MNIPINTQALVEAKLDAHSLLNLIQTCHAYKDAAEELARIWLLARHGSHAANHWRHLTWHNRLRLETCFADFDRTQCSDFIFSDDGTVELNGLGPKLLLSDTTTSDRPTLGWRFFVRGNSAVEVGVVPDDIPYDNNALHHCPKVPVDGIPTGVYSDVCGGSGLRFVAPIVKNSYVEVVVSRGAFHIVVDKPIGEVATIGSSGFAVPTAFRMSLDYGNNNNNRGVRLALTAWANAKFEFI